MTKIKKPTIKQKGEYLYVNGKLIAKRGKTPLKKILQIVQQNEKFLEQEAEKKNYQYGCIL